MGAPLFGEKPKWKLDSEGRKMTGLRGKTKEELRALSQMSLEYSNLELSEEGTEIWTNIHLKLRNISNACTCKEDSNA